MNSQILKNNLGRNETFSPRETSFGEGSSQPLHPLIDLEENDDDIIVSSPRDFAKAVANARRTRQRTGDDINMEVQAILTHVIQEYPMLQPIDDIYINLKESDVVGNATKTLEIQEETPGPEPPKVCHLKCPLCMGPFMEEMTTRCGHIFCKICIKVAMKARRICPTCGKKATPRGLVRVFLPSSAEGSSRSC